MVDSYVAIACATTSDVACAGLAAAVPSKSATRDRFR